MSFVNIIYGDAPVVPLLSAPKKIAIIGRATNFSGLIDNIGSAAQLTNNYPGLITETDSLYIATKDFIARNGGAASVVCYALAGSASQVTDVEFVGPKNGVNGTFYVPYSPADSYTGLEIYVNEALEPETGTCAAGWYDVIGGTSGLYVGDVWNGGIQVDSTGLTFEIAVGNAMSGVHIESGYRLRADITPNALGLAAKELSDDGVYFQWFAFAYDPVKQCGANPDINNTAEKYHSGYCLSETSWGKDLYMGAAMADSLNAAKKRCQFVFSLPDKVRNNETVASGYITGCALEGLGATYEDLNSYIGQKKFVSACVSKQIDDADTNVDPAIEVAAYRLKDTPRVSLTFRASELGQGGSYADAGELVGWRSAHINSTMYYIADVYPQGALMWGGNYTFGVGVDGDMNQVQCKNLLASRLESALYQILFTRTLKYDLASIQRIEDTIRAAIQQAVVDNIIDGVGTITIPIKQYLKNEDDLNAGELAVLTAARASKTVDNITAEYIWNGDIEIITISALVASYV